MKILIFLCTLIIVGLCQCTPYIQAECQAAVSPELLHAAQNATKDSMREAWQHGTEAHEQPVHVMTAPDGSVALAQNVPRQIIMLPDNTLGLSEGTHITIVPAAQPTPQPTAPPTPEPNKIIVRSNITEQEISATVAISGDPGDEQLSAVQTVSTNHKNLAEEMLDLAWTKVIARALLVIPLTVVPFLAVCFAFLYLMRKIKLEETKFAEKCINGGGKE